MSATVLFNVNVLQKKIVYMLKMLKIILIQVDIWIEMIFDSDENYQNIFKH